MAQLKMLKMPKKPRVPKKPAASASLATKENWLKKVQQLKLKYAASERAVFSANNERKKINEKSKKLSTIISGIGDIVSIRPGSTSAYATRPKKRKTSTAKVSGTRRPAAKKKAAPKRKAAPKKKTARRRY